MSDGNKRTVEVSDKILSPRKPSDSKITDGDGQSVSQPSLAMNPAAKDEVDVFKMSTSDLPIKITNKKPITYHNCSQYDRALAEDSNFWHLIVIHHNCKYSKSQILDALFKVAAHSEFFPVAYRQTKIADFFFIRLCRAAISKFFQRGLVIEMHDKTDVKLTIKFKVAEYKLGQIFHGMKLTNALKARSTKLVTHENVTNVLNLDNIQSSPELEEIIINCASNSTTALFCSLLAHNRTIFNNVNGLILSNNQFLNLSPFTNIRKLNFRLLDLRNNKITDVGLLRSLNKFTFTELYIAGNPLADVKGYENKIAEILPFVLKIDGKSVRSDPSNKAPQQKTSTTNKSDQPMVTNTSTKVTSMTDMQLNHSKQSASTAPTTSSSLPFSSSTTSSSSVSASKPPPAPSSAKPVTLKINTINPVAVTKNMLTTAINPAAIAAKSAGDTKSINPYSLVRKDRPSGHDDATEKQLAAFRAASNTDHVPIELTYPGDTIKSGDCKAGPYHFRKYKTSTMWHQVVINHDGEYSKSTVLTSISAMMPAQDFYPCYYTEDRQRDTFFVRNCYDQLDILYTAKLLVKMPKSKVPLSLILRMNVANFKSGQIDANDQIGKAIEKSFTLMDKTLNLDTFSNRPELKNIEIGLKNPATLAQILLQSARRFLANIEKLQLGNNGLTSGNGMRPLTWMKSLRSLDLSNNLISNISDLESMPELPLVTDVQLSGNPLCSSLPPSLQYISQLKKVFPALIRLDTQSLSSNGCGITQKNYLCSPEGYALVEQFITQYFATYDSVGRPNMKGLYAENALMTMSSNFAGITKAESQIRKYVVRSRNILKITNYATASATTFEGAEMIESVWRSFGTTEHDYRSFSVDLTYYKPKMIVLTVNGIFKEQGVSLNEEEMIFGFVRNFVLKQVKTGMGLYCNSQQFHITNEQVLIYRPSILQLKNAFPMAEQMDVEESAEPTSEEKDGLIIMFQEVTRLVPIWCIRCLEQAAWNFKDGLILFVHLCKEKKVPSAAFQCAVK